MQKWFFILFIPCCQLLAQDQISVLLPPKHAVQTSFSIQNTDLFASLAYDYRLKPRLEVGLEFGLGLRKSIFLPGFYPQVALHSAYKIVERRGVQLSPALRFASSTLFLPQSRVNYFSPELGFQANYGARLKFFIQGYFGRSWFNQTEVKQRFPYWSYNFGIGLRYVC